MIRSIAGRAAKALASVPSRSRDVARRRSGIFVVLVTLGLLGAGYAAFSPTSQAAPATDAIAVRQGKQLYDQGCISCHGRNLQGIEGRGPSLIGVGAASVDFQVSTGRMPLAAQGAQAVRKPAKYDDKQTQQLAAYIQSVGGGPEIPTGQLASSDRQTIAEGGRLFRLNCSSCHSFGMGGGALSSGKTAPPLTEASDKDIYEAMLTGPQNMPVFGENQLTPDEKKAIVSYIKTQVNDQQPGGFEIGRMGPMPEGLVAFVVGIVALLFVTLWIAGKS